MYYLTERQQKLKKEIREFVDAEITPQVAELDRQGIYPRELVRKIAERGYCSLPFPKELGGAGLGVTEAVIFLEEISRGMASLGLIYCAHILPCCYTVRKTCERKAARRVAHTGDKGRKAAHLRHNRGARRLGRVRRRYHGRAQRGRLAAQRLEMLDNQRRRCRRYIINAKTGSSIRSRNVSLFYVDAKTPGLEVSRSEDMIGLNNSPTGTVTFNNCLLPPDALIGEENSGYKHVKLALNCGRLSLAAVSIGLAQSAFEHAVEFARSRGDYGRTIFSYQGVSFPIAEMYSNINLARNSLYHVAAITEAGKNATLETASLKLFSSEMCQKVCKDAVLIHGGRGFRSHCDVERMLRDSQLLTVAEGTSQICKVIISNGINNTDIDKLNDLM